MSRVSRKKHTHMYRKDANGIWFCALPFCSHHMPWNVSQHVVNSASLCNNCMAPIFMTEDIMKMNEPICDSCIEGVKLDATIQQNDETKPNINEIPDEILDNLFEPKIVKTFMDGVRERQALRDKENQDKDNKDK